MLFILKTVHYTVLNGDSDTLFISVTMQEQKVWSAPTIIFSDIRCCLEPFDVNESMYAQGNNNIVALIKVQTYPG